MAKKIITKMLKLMGEKIKKFVLNSKKAILGQVFMGKGRKSWLSIQVLLF